MITWSTYLSAVCISLVGYYGVILLIYFRRELFSKIKSGAAKASETESPLKSNVDDVVVEDNAFHPSPLLDEIHAYMNQASKELPKEQDEVVAGIKSILQKYPPLLDPFFRLSINDLVVSLAESKCNVEISQEVLARLWR